MKKVTDITKNSPKRLNISFSPVFSIPLKTILRYTITGMIVISFFTGFVQAPQISFVLAEEQSSEVKQMERDELERQLKEYERQIEETQSTIDVYRKQGNTLKGDISILNARISKLNLQIKTVNINLSKLNNDINSTQVQINQTENKIDSHRGALAKSLQSIYESDKEGLLAILLANNQLSDFFGKINDIQLIQDNLRISLENVTKLRQELLDQKQELSFEKQDAESLRNIQQSQKSSVAGIQGEKAYVLKVTQGKESEYQKILKEKQAQAAKIRIRIFELLGGGQLTFEKAYEYALMAEKATGVRAAFILGVLHRESLFGANTGRCKYNDINLYSGKTNMSPSQIPAFEEILAELGIDPNSNYAMISCPNKDGTYGGAMGPAQFIPTTWKAYKSKVAQLTGHNPPSPWNNADAFVASGLYLQDYGADAQTNTAEKRAAAIYYCGTNWKRYSCSYYAGKVVDSANKFQDDIDILEGR